VFHPLALLLAAQAATPGPAATDIFLLELRARSGQPVVSGLVRVTDWKGYDNQPSFTPDGRALLYTSIREDGQADVHRYELAAKTSARVTATAEAEYSPTVTPDGRGVSMVRVEKDGTQRLWRIPIGPGAPALLLPDVKPVGYHAWLDADTLALFVLGRPATLQLASLKTGRAEIVASDIGRSIHRIPGRRQASYVDKSAAWTIRRLDVASRKSEPIVATLDGSEDYAWTRDGRLLMAQGARLFVHRPGLDAGWRFLADLGGQGVRRITRLAVSPAGDRLALVAAQPGE
jgi:dipeptidyl aminopeptidase/acylaminoacyl peptidase